MATNSISKTQILHLYRSLLKASKNFSSYNFRDYFYRHTRDSFHKNKFETSPHKILEFIKKSENELATLKRQSYLSSLYSGEKLVIEGDGDSNKLLKDETGEQFRMRGWFNGRVVN
ncbi:8240_t:CDS:2 [Entrophospora sp. SA101]|nr:8240_t:CDS:2 [Entrophospora sp. SA101]